MNTEEIRELLECADRAAGQPSYGPVSAAWVRRQVRRRRLKSIVVPVSAAAVLLVGLGIWGIATRTRTPAVQREERIASLEQQVEQLQAQTQAALKLVQDVLAQDRQQQRLDALEAELASIRDPREQMQEQADRTALTLLYQADRFYREMKQTQSAVETYEQVIRVFPQSRWADEARDRLARIREDESGRI